MNQKILFPRKFTAAEQDAFLRQIKDRFVFDGALWQRLLFNGLPFGFINERWRGLLVRDWQGEAEVLADSLNLLSQDWLTMGDALQTLTQDWHERGEFHGWRNEKFDVCDASGKVLFALERSAFRPLGLLSNAVHINGMAECNGETGFWIGRRSPFKAVDPDKLDNVVGGGVASGESIEKAMVREGWEEAGLPEALLAGLACRSRLLSLRSVSRGLHREWLHIFDVWLPEGVVPENQDGEVAEFSLMGIDDLAGAMAEGLFMNDAMVATLDCCRRFGLLDAAHPLSFWLEEMHTGSQLNGD
ncbi:MAG: NUDIX domain-containing protein [Neisseria sp.]|uniref:NUDIX hydrolase n=1 Tax=Neisseria sp. TaxID=192066 RepID=UPI0026DBDC61|nr:NUDIX domain-containing protein [Neisseria sp.]MDO4642079.1 NUDIX domain-containing protein [Neisseria sp.]